MYTDVLVKAPRYMSSLPRTHKKRAEHNLLRGSWLGRRDGASLDDSSKLGYRDQIRLPMISTDSIEKNVVKSTLAKQKWLQFHSKETQFYLEARVILGLGLCVTWGGGPRQGRYGHVARPTLGQGTQRPTLGHWDNVRC